MELFAIFKKSVYGPSFYRSLAERPLSFSIKYFYLLATAFALVLTISYSLSVIPALDGFLRSVGAALLAEFPEDLVITIEGGLTSVNRAEPVRILLPKPLENPGMEGFRHLLVIDTTQSFTEEHFRSLQSFIWLTRESVVYAAQRDGRISIQPLGNFPDVVIDRSDIVGLTRGIRGLSGWLSPLVVIVTFFFFMFGFTAKLLYVFVAAALVMLIGRIKGLAFSYGVAYRVGLHAISLPLAVDSLMLAAYQGFNVPFLFTFVTLFVIWFNIFPDDSVAEPQAVTEKPTAA